MAAIGRYRILGQVGRGDTTIVYRALDPLLEREVAVKTLRPEVDPAAISSAEWRAQFRRDVEAASRLKHPHIAAVYDADFHEDRPYVVSELIAGETLASAITRNALTRPEKIRIALQLAGALAYAHGIGVVHHQVRPNNVLLTPEINVKITDFGSVRLARTRNDTTPVPGQVPTHYRAPEQIYGKKLDQRTDVFSLGVVLYELFVGRRAFEGDSWGHVTQKILTADPPFLRDSSGEIPAALIAVLHRSLAKDPLDRYQSPDQVLRDLEIALVDSPLTPAEGNRDIEHTTSSTALPGPAARDQATLIVEEGGRRQIIPITADEFTIGRRKDNDLAFRDEASISRQHAKIVRADGRLTLYDWPDPPSKHGTFLNGERVTTAPLRSGDRIDLGKGGRFKITVRLGAEQDAQEAPRPALHERNLELLLDISYALNSSLSVDDVLNVIMDAALTFSGAERGFIMLRDAQGKYRTRISRFLPSPLPPPGEDAVSTGVVERCLASMAPIVIHNIDEFSEFSNRDSILDLSLKSILCVPLIYKGTVLGVLYLDSRELKAPFKSIELDLLVAFAAHAAVALENARLYELAIVDTLTGVYLKHHFLTRLTEEFQRAERHTSHLSLIFIDVDFFKRVNDTHGHPVGDVVLKWFADIARSVARSTDVVARYGGEEFVILAPETGLEAAAALAERLRDEIRAEPCQSGDLAIKLTASFGVACYPGTAIHAPTDLILKADNALLKAKEAGRDRVQIAE